MYAAHRCQGYRKGRQLNLLIGLSVVVAGASTYAQWPTGRSARQVSNQYARKAQDPMQPFPPLEMRLDDLKQRAPVHGEMARNPFRFYVRTPLPRRNPLASTALMPLKPSDLRDAPPAPAAPPAIPIKFIGVLTRGTKRVAIFTDGNGLPVWASEGQTVLGLYKLLRISVESVTMSYLDGSGMQTIPMRG